MTMLRNRKTHSNNMNKQHQVAWSEIDDELSIGGEKVVCSAPKAKLNAIEDELSKIVGLDELKIQLRKWLKGMVLDEMRREIGLEVGPRRLPQLAFLGNPGTGKTMIARMLGKLLHMVGIIKKDHVIEVQRTDLVGQYIGQTGPQTREMIKKAEGGILFIDEAYRLVPVDATRDFGPQALEEIMSFMDKEKLVVIFAGYKEPMNRVISSNEGIRRRISNIFNFEDFSCEQLAKIMNIKLPNTDKNSPFYGFKLEVRATSVKDVAALIERGTSAELRSKMNGGLVDQMLIKARENLDSRINVECTDKYSMMTITREDLAAGLRLLRVEEQIEEKAEQEKQKVASTDDTKVKMNAIDNELSKIVGLDALKVQLRTWLKGMLMDERRRAIRGMVGARKLPQLAFLGNPGTGKTMVAHVLGKLLHMVGILPKDKVTEVQRTDLVEGYIGQTGPKTREKIKEAEGGILFVDEAYRLVPAQKSYRDFGLEALEEIMSFMDKEKVVVIFAGYTEPMDRVITSNAGMARRISNVFHFDDFSCEQLAKILHLKVPSKDENSPFYGFELDSNSTSVKDVASLIERGTSAEQRGKMNGGLVDQMLVKAIENLDSRIDFECKDEHSMVAITSEDLAAGLRWLEAEEKSVKSKARENVNLGENSGEEPVESLKRARENTNLGEEFGKEPVESLLKRARENVNLGENSGEEPVESLLKRAKENTNLGEEFGNEPVESLLKRARENTNLGEEFGEELVESLKKRFWK